MYLNEGGGGKYKNLLTWVLPLWYGDTVYPQIKLAVFVILQNFVNFKVFGWSPAVRGSHSALQGLAALTAPTKMAAISLTVA